MNLRPVLGLVGQVCAGKGTVAEAFRRRGARVFDADRVVHGLYGRADVLSDVRRVFGPGVFDARDQVDRRKLAALVFDRPERLGELTGILFPRVRAEFRAARAEFERSADLALVFDAPTLFEAGSEGACARIIFVAAPRERREEWAARRGWPPSEIARRERCLLSEEEKRSRCHAVIENRGSLEDLDRQVGELWHKWIIRDGEKEESKA
jgi:dephospho-CoA kinase